MSYRVLILNRAKKELSRLPKRDFDRVRDAIRSLADEPRPPGSLKLVGRDGRRIRVGDYRIVYEIDDSKQFLTVLHVGHRRDVYG